ncbi:MAG: leucine-rich repeat protein [Clostridia bacterium]|nr:leucine-rich repeat protein [Clostridia bacterium]
MKRRVYFGLLLCFALLICTLLLTACDQGEQPATPADTTLEQTETEAPPDQPEHVHEFGEWVVITEPICGQNGERERACACGEVERETIDPTAAEHTYDTYNVCIACGQTMPYTQNLRFEETPDQKGYVVGASQMLTDKVIVVPPYYEGKPVVGILPHAFGGMTEIESFVLPDTIVTIGPSAFVGCTGLVSITLPGCVTEIGECAFERCTSLSEIYLSPNLEVVGSRAFAGCTAIEQMILPETVHTIGAGAFVECGFKEILIPASVTQLGKGAFSGCKSLKNAFIVASITVLPSDIFAKCTELCLVDLPLGLLTIESGAFSQCALVEVILPDTVLELAQGAFIECKQLVAVIGGDLEVGEQAFVGCMALERKPHVHKYTEHLVRDPGCTANGVFMMTCTGCDKNYSKEIPATGHVLEDREGRPATCTSSGYSAYKKCKNCSYREGYERYERLPHSLGELIPEVPATCTSEGVRAHYFCDSCEQLFEQDGQTATDEIELSIPFDDHAWGEWVEQVDATCDTHGMLGHYRCEVCNFYFDAEKQPMGNPTIVATGHTFGDWYMHTEATCTEGGEERMTCHCGYYISIFHPAKGHTYQGDWYVYTEVSCTVDGEKRIDCVDCDYYDSIIINATGHHFGGWELYTPALCTQNGEDRRYCECGEYEVNAIPATGHDYKSSLVKPTCTEQGYLAHTCHCGDVYKDTFTEPYGHQYTATVTKPTCIEQGYTTHTCARCQDTYVDTYTATVGHTIENKIVSATCTEGGYIEHTCTYCGYSYTSSHSDPKGHNFWVWETDVQATCTQDGRESRYCTRCKLVEERVIEAIGHQYTESVKAATCTTDGYTTHSCSSCGYTYTDSYVTATGHSYTDWVVEKPATCVDVGRETRYCTKCGIGGLNVLPALGHDYVPEVIAPTCWKQGYTTYTCQNCGRSYDDNYTDRLTHIYGEWQLEKQPTCTKPGANGCYCALCEHHKIESIPALGHDYSIVEIVQPTCTANGFTLHTCARCDESYRDSFTDTLMHDYEVTEVAPTCSEKGYTAYTCSLCGNEIIDDEVPALGHDYVATVIAPGCTSNGYTSYDCSRCEDYYHADHTYATGHVSEPIPPVEPTFQTHGWIGGRRCAVCGMQLEAQTQVGMYRHIYVEYNEAAVIVDAPDKASFGTYITITATPKSGYEFVGWYIGDVLMCETPEYTFQVGIDEYTYTAKVKGTNAWDGTIASSFAGGSGTKDDPYLISNGWELAYLAYQINYGNAAQYNNKYYALTADIDLNNVNWDPIGSIYNASGVGETSKSFIGHFDGRGFTVYNLFINASKYNFNRFFGLFGVVEAGGYIENVNVSNCNIDIDGDVKGQVCCGGIAGRIVTATVANCTVNGKISASTSSSGVRVGGIVGITFARSVIADCHAEVTVRGYSSDNNAFAGGIAGNIEDTTIARCWANAKVSASGSGSVYVATGGIAGYAHTSSVIYDCYSSGSVSGSNRRVECRVGGVVGALGGATVTRCYSTCTVFSQSEDNAIAGGIVGHLLSADYSNSVSACLSLASVSADNYGGRYTYTGKIYGYKASGSLSNNPTSKTDTVGFYTSTLGWSADVWDFSAVESGGLPTLKH